MQQFEDDNGENEINDTGGGVKSQGLVRAGSDSGRAGHDVLCAKDVADSGVLEKDGKFVGPSGDGNAHGLGEDDAPDGLQIAHSQSPCSLKLSGRN